MRSNVKYRFVPVETCNMCGSASDRHCFLGRRLNRSQGSRPLKKSGITVSIFRCRDCGLIFSNPMPVPELIQDHYNIEPELYWNEKYFEQNKQYFRGEIDTLKSLTDTSFQLKTLDIGAGLGKTMTALTNAGFDSFGIEPSKAFYEMAIEKFGISPEKLLNTSIEQAEFPEDYFDFISFGAVLEHLYDPSESILIALKWLKPGGVMRIAVPSADWLVGKFINIYYRFRGTRFVTNLSPMHEPFHLYEFSARTFQIHSRQHNYEIALIQHFVDQTFMPKMFDGMLKPIMKATKTGLALAVWVRKK